MISAYLVQIRGGKRSKKFMSHSLLTFRPIYSTLQHPMMDLRLGQIGHDLGTGFFGAAQFLPTTTHS